MKRIAIIGTSCSGKTIFNYTISKKLNLKPIDIDNIFWQPGWQNISREELLEKVKEEIEADSWAISGNYSVCRETIWAKADTVVWLDYSFPFIFYRALKRSIIRIITALASSKAL